MTSIKATPRPETASIDLEITKVADNVVNVMRSDANGLHPVRPMEGQLPSNAVSSEARRNLVLNPSFDTAGATTTLATNYAPNPSFETSVSEWSHPGADCTRSTTRVRSGSYSLAVSGKGTDLFVNPSISFTALQPNTNYRISIWTFSAPGNTYPTFIRVGGDVLVVGNTDQNFTTGQWVKHSRDFTTNTDVPPIVPIYLYSGGGASEVTYWDELLVTEAAYEGTYFDGSTNDGEHTYSWAGTPNASSSMKQAVAPANWLELVPSSLYDTLKVDDFMRIKVTRAEATTIAVCSDPINVSALSQVAISANFRSGVPVSQGTINALCTRDDGTVFSITAPTEFFDAGAWKRIGYTIDTTGITSFRVQILNTLSPDLAGEMTFDVDDVLVEAGNELLPYFDGNTVDPEMGTYSWDLNGQSILTNGGTFIMNDYEAASGTVSYIVNQNVAGVSEAYVTVNTNLPTPWLMMPILPQFSKNIETITGFDSSRPMSSTVHPILGRSNPLVTIGKLQSRRGQFEVFSREYTQARELEQVFARGEIVMLRQNVAGMDMYLTAEGVDTAPLLIAGDDTRWRTTVRYVETLRPEGFRVGTLGWTYEDITASYASYDSVADAFLTYDDLTLGDAS